MIALFSGITLTAMGRSLGDDDVLQSQNHSAIENVSTVTGHAYYAALCLLPMDWNSDGVLVP